MKPKKKYRKRISPISKKRQGELYRYSHRKKLFMAAHPNCCVEGCHRKSSDLHHRNGRQGKMLLDQRYWRAICRWHHNLVDIDREWARVNDLLPRKGHPWNTPDDKP